MHFILISFLNCIFIKCYVVFLFCFVLFSTHFECLSFLLLDFHSLRSQGAELGLSLAAVRSGVLSGGSASNAELAALLLPVAPTRRFLSCCTALSAQRVMFPVPGAR